MPDAGLAAAGTRKHAPSESSSTVAGIPTNAPEGATNELLKRFEFGATREDSTFCPGGRALRAFLAAVCSQSQLFPLNFSKMKRFPVQTMKHMSGRFKANSRLCFYLYPAVTVSVSVCLSVCLTA